MVRISNLELIETLEKNARASFVEIAKKFGVSEAAVRKRVRKLEKEGIIKGYTIEVDHRKLGLEINALIGFDTKPEKYIDVINQLKGMKEIKKLYSSTGDHMLMAECWFKDSVELEKFVKKLESIDDISRICPAIILERLK